MNTISNYEGTKNYETLINRNWLELRTALASKKLFFYDITEAKKYTFLKTYDDLLCNNNGIKYQTTILRELNGVFLGRGTVLKCKEVVDYERFIPKKEFIKEDNRFSPQGVEWLYLALGDENDIHLCSQTECKANVGDRFGFCHFEIDDSNQNLKLADLTIADNITYDVINTELNKSIDVISEKKSVLLRDGDISDSTKCKEDAVNAVTKWAVYVYTKLLSEQVFQPLSDLDDKAIMYAPFHTIAQYYISLGFSGIIYRSTVSEIGKNIVLFDKNIAHPTGVIEDYIL